MSDVSDLVGRLRGPIKHPQQSVSLRLEAGDALETLAGEVEEIKELFAKDHAESIAVFSDLERVRDERDELRNRLAKLAPVVEAARDWARSMKALGNGLSIERMERSDSRLLDALATLEAAHE